MEEVGNPAGEEASKCNAWRGTRETGPGKGHQSRRREKGREGFMMREPQHGERHRNLDAREKTSDGHHAGEAESQA